MVHVRGLSGKIFGPNVHFFPSTWVWWLTFWKKSRWVEIFSQFIGLVDDFFKTFFWLLIFLTFFAGAVICYMGDFLVRSTVLKDTSSEAVKFYVDRRNFVCSVVPPSKKTECSNIEFFSKITKVPTKYWKRGLFSFNFLNIGAFHKNAQLLKWLFSLCDRQIVQTVEKPKFYNEHSVEIIVSKIMFLFALISFFVFFSLDARSVMK